MKQISNPIATIEFNHDEIITLRLLCLLDETIPQLLYDHFKQDKKVTEKFIIDLNTVLGDEYKNRLQ